MTHYWVDDCDGQIYCKKCGEYINVRAGKLSIPAYCEEKE
jgi:hypothetical protein